MRLALLLTSGLAVVLAALLGVELLTPPPADDALAVATGVMPASRVHLPSAAPSEALAPALHSEEWVATILARPLFTRDRRPPKENSSVASAGPSDSLPRLTGIAISPDRRRAIFAGTDGAKPIVVEEGGSIAGFTVSAIAPDGIEVQGPSGERKVALAFDPNPPAVSGPNPDLNIPQQQQQPNQPPFFGQPGQPSGPPAYPGYGQPFNPNRQGPPIGPNGQPFGRPPFGRPRAELFDLHPDARSS